VTTLTGALNLNNTEVVTPTTANGIQLQPYSTGAGDTSELQFYELAASGSDYVGFKAPDSLGSTAVYTLPDATGASSDYVLTYQAGNIMQWKSANQLNSVITAVGDVSSGPAF